MPPSFFSGALRGADHGLAGHVLEGLDRVAERAAHHMLRVELRADPSVPASAAARRRHNGNAPCSDRRTASDRPAPASSCRSRRTPRATAACCVRPAMAERCTTPLVEPPIACSMTMALRNASLVMISDGFGPPLVISAARLPVASAMRMRSAWTAGIVAAPGSVMPIASIMQAMVLAVPITPQVPIDGTSRSLATSISSPLMRPPRNSPHRSAAIGAGAEHLALEMADQHRADRQHDGRPVGAHRRHHLRRRGLVAAADQHHRIHRQRADHLLGVHRHQIAQEHRGRIGEAFVDRDGRKHHRHGAGRASRRASPPRSVAARCRGRD